MFKTKIFFPSIDLILSAATDRINKSADIITATRALYPQNLDFFKFRDFKTVC
jgi:hypothetical protein